MRSQKRIKFIIALAILIVVTLLTTTVVQLVCISKAKNKIEKQQEQIQTLNDKLDYYENK